MRGVLPLPGGGFQDQDFANCFNGQPMKIEKRVLTTLPSCYATNSLEIDAQRYILLASEGNAPCLAWKGPDYTESHVVWNEPGGTMSIVPIPGTNGEFLAVQKFYRFWDWEDAKVVHVAPDGAGNYVVTDILHLPYVHRFDLLSVGGRHYFIACTLATTKRAVDEWSNPGKIWVGEYTGHTGDRPLAVRVLKDGISKNHGYSRLAGPDGVRGLVTGEEGAFEVTPPGVGGDDWQVRQFMDWPISDIAALDIDGDGELEYATIEPFHGSYFRIYKRIDGTLRKVFEHPEVTEFYHVVVGANLAGVPVFIGGCRRGKQELFYVRSDPADRSRFKTELIEAGVGPSNVQVLNEAGRDIIAAANRETNEAALYIVTPD